MEDAVRRLPHPRTQTISHIFIGMYRLDKSFQILLLGAWPLTTCGALRFRWLGRALGYD